MRLTLADWVVVALYFLFNIAVGLYYKSRASQNTAEFFLSGRNVPWWLAGTSMVATTFAADTPLVVTGLVAQNGIAGNWLWWNLLASGMLTVFFYARLWRRSGVMSDIEFAEIRYAGPPAAFLRGFRAVYLVLLINCSIFGWVKLGAIDQLRGATTGGQGSVLSFVPDVGSAWMPMITFFVYIAVNWWATWYPGAEPGGGGYVAQRMLSAKDEKNSLLATLWFN